MRQKNEAFYFRLDSARVHAWLEAWLPGRSAADEQASRQPCSCRLTPWIGS
jgi:hypothetical protein